MRTSFVGFAFSAMCSLSLASSVAEELGEVVTIRLVGYPEVRVNELQACGQRTILKSNFNPDYLFHYYVLGWRDGNCSAIGYSNYDHTTVIERKHYFLPATHVSFDVYTRDPTALDVAGCIYRECGDHLKLLEKSDYVSDATHCVSPAFGPCVDKAWDCLGDDVCRGALNCLPSLARDCGQAAWRALIDPKEREKIECIWRCNNSKVCIIEKCTVDALECFTGVGDKLCHEAVMCIPEKLMSCSSPAFHCIFSTTDSVCRDNLECVASGIGTCADPIVNLATDRNISELISCANQKCPKPVVPQQVATERSATPEFAVAKVDESLPQWPVQAACMSLHCGLKGAGLLLDKDVQAFSTCALTGVESCGSDIWDCLGNKSCQADVECWTEGLVQNADDLWKLVTDQAERNFDEDLAQCVKGCGQEFEHLPLRVMCVLGKCGAKSTKCLADPTCRHVFTDLPWTLGKCGKGTISNSKFLKAAQCAGHIAGVCGTTAVELLRDQKIAELIDCNAQCTRAPGTFGLNVTSGNGPDLNVVV